MSGDDENLGYHGPKARDSKPQTAETVLVAEAAVPTNAPVMIAWTGYQKTEEFANAERWAAHPEHLLGSLWRLFYAGFYAAAMQAAERAALSQPLPREGEWICVNGHDRCDGGGFEGCPYCEWHVLPHEARNDGWRSDCPKCVASKFVCDEHNPYLRAETAEAQLAEAVDRMDGERLLHVSTEAQLQERVEALTTQLAELANSLDGSEHCRKEAERQLAEAKGEVERTWAAVHRLERRASEAEAQRDRLREGLELLQGFDFRLDDSDHGKEIRRRVLCALRKAHDGVEGEG